MKLSIYCVTVGCLLGAARAQYSSLDLSDFWVFSANLSYGRAGCRCLEDVRALLNETAPQLLAPASANATCSGLSDGLTCLPADYGQDGCTTYDLLTSQRTTVSTACARPDAPLYCKDSFCFVDGRACDNIGLAHATTYLFNGHHVPEAAMLRYSYSTCGQRDRFFVQKLSKQKMTIRVTAPITLSPTVHFSKGQGEVWTGPAWTILQDMITEMNIEVKIVNLTVEAMEMAPYYDAWWACVHMIAINYTDICIGDFWDTKERREYMLPLGTFTIPYSHSSYMLATKLEIQKSSEPWEFSDPLRPFTMQLWGAIVACIILGAMAYSACETIAAIRRDDLARERERRASLSLQKREASTKPSFFDPDYPQAPEERREIGLVYQEDALGSFRRLLPSFSLRARRVCRSITGRHHVAGSDAPEDYQDKDNRPDGAGSTMVDAVYANITTILNRTEHKPRSHGGRLFKIAMALFSLVVLRYWSSLITTGLVIDNTGMVARANSLSEASERNRGDKVCASGFLAENLFDGLVDPPVADPWDKDDVKRSLVLESGRGPHPYNIDGDLMAVQDDFCQHLLVDLDMFTYKLAKNPQYCNIGIVGHPIQATMPIAYPIRVGLESMFSEWYRRNLAKYAILLQTEVNNLNLPCEPLGIHRDAPQGDSTGIQYGVKNFTSEFTVILVAAVLSVILSYVFPGVPNY